MPRELVFENLSAYNRAPQSHYRDYTHSGAPAHGRDDEHDCCREQQQSLGYKVEDVHVQTDDFPIQRLAAKESVVIELMSPGRAHEAKIADYQQDNANQRPQEESILNSPDITITHTNVSNVSINKSRQWHVKKTRSKGGRSLEKLGGVNSDQKEEPASLPVQ